MKNLKYLFLCLFCFFLHQSIAQISIGVKGGTTKAWEDYGDVELPDAAEIHIKGYHVSALAYFEINRFLKVGIEPTFIERGAACVPGWMPIFEGDTKLFLNYVDVPLMVSGRLPLFSNRFEVFGKLGYGGSYLASATEEVTFIGTDDPPQTSKIDLTETDQLSRWDYGGYGSFGIATNFGIHQIFVESSYYMGRVDADNFNTSKNRNLNFSVGYMIRL